MKYWGLHHPEEKSKVCVFYLIAAVSLLKSKYSLTPTEVPDTAAGNKNAALPASQVHSAINPASLLFNIATISITAD